MSEKEEKNKNKSDDNVVNQSARGITNLIFVQVITKLFTFLLNQLIIRYLTPSIIGITTYLDFIYSTVLFFSRESLRLSIQRIQNDSNSDRSKANQKVVNFGRLALIIALPILLVVGYWQANYSMITTTLVQLPFHVLTVTLVFLLIVLELVTEPIYCLYQFQLDFGKRSKFEGLAILVKCVVTFMAVMVVRKYAVSQDYFTGAAISGFALGQFSYSFTLFVCYFVSFKNEYSSKDVSYSLVQVKDDKEVYYFQPDILVLVRGFFVQMIFKQFLTEGDKLLISYLCTIEEQGVYAVIANYGSMVARLLFQPLEESTRLMFTKLLNGAGNDNSKYTQSYRYLKLISVFYFNLSLLILFAGVTNGSFLLKILMGGKASNWADTNIFEVFPQYVVYIPFLAFNGILEALFSCMATTSDLQSFSKFMTFITVAILAILYLLIDRLDLRISGLILANIINMIFRIVYCYLQIESYYLEHGIGISLGNVLRYTSPSIAVTGVVWAAQLAVIGKYTTSFLQLILSAGMSVVVLLLLLVLERENLKQPLAKFIKRKSE
ncbi:Oligosaccharide translocation protein RFT1 [Candida viswanathii]|uniref:Man(5)GlcNAc(2)-PP-dolichol translocation protein RFT1 n=1 Tax=Candida viswanathii TaxID=5486 RepID=A0A367YD45_9ASCO|nr:Oligosaccharide translocation protein RFT1 [Candida viswanathii]